LEQVGLSVDDKGELSLNEQKFTAAFNENSGDLKTLFTDKTKGIAAKLNSVIESLAGSSGSVLSSRADTLSRIIDTNTERIDVITASLDRQRDRLLLQFYQIESTIAKMQDDLKALSSFQVVPPLTSSSS
jgi:flagellar hook-associated protein 2